MYNIDIDSLKPPHSDYIGPSSLVKRENA